MPTRIFLRETGAPSPRATAATGSVAVSQASTLPRRNNNGRRNIFSSSSRDPYHISQTNHYNVNEIDHRDDKLAARHHRVGRSSTVDGDLSPTSSYDNSDEGEPSSSYLPTGSSSGNGSTIKQRQHEQQSEGLSSSSSIVEMSTIHPNNTASSSSSAARRIVTFPRSSILRRDKTESNGKCTNGTSIGSMSNRSRSINRHVLPSYKRDDVGGRGSCAFGQRVHRTTTSTTRYKQTDDIRTSPRLMGYLFQLLACTVMLISAIQFYRGQQNERFIKLLATFDEEKQETYHYDDNNGEKGIGGIDKSIFASVNGPVYYWKLMGCVAVGSVGVAVSLIILLVHFDTICFPRLWSGIFRDGSKFEFVLLWTNVLFWIVGLYVCTSSLSVGEVQANVYFTTWIAFVASVVNCGVWRMSAGLPSLAEQITFHHRETTYNWLWTFLFVSIVAGSVSDIYINRDDITLRLKGKVLDLSQNDWVLILSLSWGFVGVCIMALTLNHYCHHEISIRLWQRIGGGRFVLGWRQLEGFAILGMVVVFFWMIYQQTGVNGIVNGLNNAYFGVWGSFFNAVFTFGTWIRENRNIEFIIRDENEHDDDNKRSREVDSGVTRVRFAPGT